MTCRALAVGFLPALPGLAAAQTLDYGGFKGMFDEPVTISATGEPEPLSDTPVSMDVVTAAARISY